ncbi:MAG: hypothetical protein AAF675_18450 [Pseudomonadota bacterium]
MIDDAIPAGEPTLCSLLIDLTTAAAETDRERLIANFRTADADADTMLTLEEFTRFIHLNAEDGLGRAAMIKRHGRESTAFGRVDMDGDGLVTPDEIRAIAKARQ